MPPAYLIKKNDTYYFRHYIPSGNQKALDGKKEFIKTLKVSKKADAVRLSRDLNSSNKCITHNFSDIHPGQFFKDLIGCFELETFSRPALSLSTALTTCSIVISGGSIFLLRYPEQRSGRTFRLSPALFPIL